MREYSENMMELNESMRGRFLILSNDSIIGSDLRDFKPYKFDSSKELLFVNESTVQDQIWSALISVSSTLKHHDLSKRLTDLVFTPSELDELLKLLKSKILEVLKRRSPIAEGRHMEIFGQPIKVDIIRNAIPDRMLTEYYDLYKFCHSIKTLRNKLFVSLDRLTNNSE